jgi:hypothetical protein
MSDCLVFPSLAPRRAIACLKIANALNPEDREVLINLGISQVNEVNGAKVQATTLLHAVHCGV